MHATRKSLLTIAASAALATSVALAGVRPAAAAAPTYAEQTSTTDETVRGVVTAFDGHFALSVRDDSGFVDRVRLHDGTLINPTGLTLAPGERVTVIGANGGDALSANEIDTPYPPPEAFADYGYPGYGYGYPGYGPSYGIGFGFGFGGRHFGRFR